MAASRGKHAGTLTALLLSLAVSGPPLQAGPTSSSHTLEPGQTLWSVAYAHGVRVEDLMRVNGIDDPSVVREGQELLIPGAATAEEPPPPPPLRTEPLLDWPLRGTISSRYGTRRRRLHAGVDIAAPKGTIIVAAAAGRVVRAGKGWGRYGKVVLLDHGNGYLTLYAHAAKVFVRDGEEIRQGQAIAAVGKSGNATGYHLHFELWGGERTLDPLRYLESEPTETALLKPE